MMITVLSQITEENSSVLKIFKSLTLAKESLLGIKSIYPTSYQSFTFRSHSHLKLNVSKTQPTISPQPFQSLPYVSSLFLTPSDHYNYACSQPKQKLWALS